MTTRWLDLADLLEGRAKRLGIPDDVADLVLVAYNVLQNIVDTYDIPTHIVQNESMFQTMPGHTTYPLPEDFGRLLGTTDAQYTNVGGTGDSGIYLVGGSTKAFSIVFQEAIAFRNQGRLEYGKPSHFTLSGRNMVLNPPPDTNGGANYLAQGTYMASVQRPDLDLQAPVLLDESTCLVAGTLYQIASDRGLPQAATLEKEYAALLSAVVNNSARRKIKMFTTRWPARWSHR